jgi:hypothetical protein
MILGVKIEEHCSTENKPAMEKKLYQKTSRNMKLRVYHVSCTGSQFFREGKKHVPNYSNQGQLK